MHHHTVLLATFSHLHIINSKHFLLTLGKQQMMPFGRYTMSLQLLGNRIGKIEIMGVDFRVSNPFMQQSKRIHMQMES
jgi:hypothetical protein